MLYEDLVAKIQKAKIEPDDAYYALLLDNAQEILNQRISNKLIMQDLKINNPSTTSTILKMLRAEVYRKENNSEQRSH